MLIKGSNSCGKSTYGKMCALTILLGQSPLIAPASNVSMSIFTDLITCMNTIDILVLNLSLYLAEIARIKKLKDACIRAKEDDGKIFSLLDECVGEQTLMRQDF